MNRELMIFSGNANPALAQEICAYLGQKLGEATVSSFSDGEIRVKIEQNVRGADVFVVQSCCQPVNDSLMELLIIIDALKRSSANRITAVIPYFGYARQDRKDEGRTPITAKLVANLITAAGANRDRTHGLRRAGHGPHRSAGPRDHRRHAPAGGDPQVLPDGRHHHADPSLGRRLLQHADFEQVEQQPQRRAGKGSLDGWMHGRRL